MASGNSLFTRYARDAAPPGTVYATLDCVTGGSTPAEKLWVLDFDASTVEYADFEVVLPRHYAGGGLTVDLEFGMSSDTNTAHTIQLEVAIRRIDTAETLSGAHTYDYNTVSTTIPSAVDKTKIATVTFSDGSDMDSWAVGERAVVRVRRNGAGTDDASGDLELHSVAVRES